MLTKKFAKYIQSFSHKKFRDEENAFVAEGPKVIEEFLSSSKFKCKVLCAQREWLQQNEASLQQLPPESIVEVGPDELKKVSSLTTPNRVLGIFEKPPIVQSVPLQGKITLALDGLQDPGNLGTIIRIADWFGIEHIVAGRETADCYNAKVVQAAMGSLLRVSVTYLSLDSFLAGADGIPVYAAVLGGQSAYKMAIPSEAVLIIGNESKGISAQVLEKNTIPISIPSFGGAESLNAAVATGILLALFKRSF